MQQSPQNREEVFFTKQSKEQLSNQISRSIAEIFSKAAYKPQSNQEIENIFLEQCQRGISLSLTS